MTVVFETDAQVINATAGTSVVVTKPTGTVAGNVIYAVIAAASNTTISTPSGWLSLGTQVASTSVRASVFRRVCDGTEPASWTWTLGASVRNWGWVGRYSGVDPITPEFATAVSATDTTAGTSFVTGNIGTHPVAPRTIAAVAVVRTASGAATTFTSFAAASDEREDMSTNGGSGTDIAGCIVDEAFSPGYNNTFTASQSCTAGVMWVVALNPLFVAYDGGEVEPIVEAAFGADPDGDPTDWVWTDISDYVMEDPGVTIGKGRQDEQSQTAPTSLSFTVLNDGRFTPGNPLGAYYPNIRRGLPVRVSVPYGFNAPTERATALVEGYSLGWDTSLNHATVEIGALGRLSRLRAGDSVRSPLFRTISGISGVAPPPVAYWPMEDGGDATVFANQVGGRPMGVRTGVRPAGDSLLPGSASLPTITAGGQVVAHIDPYPAGTQWSIIAVVRFEAPVAAETMLLEVQTTGTASQWKFSIVPGSPDTLRVRAIDSDGTGVLDVTGAVNETLFYSGWILIELSAKQVGANIAYAAAFNAMSESGVAGNGFTGTLNSRTAGNAFRTTTGGNAAPYAMEGALGHFAAFADPAFVTGAGGTATTIATLALDGKKDERTAVRFTRLLDEEGVYQDVHTAAETALLTEMGPQPVAGLDGLLREIEDAEQGVIHDGGTLGGLVLIDRSSRYNRAADLDLDMESGHIAPDWSPVYDTQKLRTRSTVSRTGGSSYTYTGDTGEGIFQDPLSLNLPDDARLADFASWRVHVGTVPGMRYPKVGMNFRRNPDLVEAWLALEIGLSRFTATGLPSQHGPVDLDAFVEGYTERLAGFKWEAELNGSPASPYTVGVWEDDVLGRADTDGTVSAAPFVAGTDTSLPVSVTAGNAWITTATHAAEFPFDVKTGGVVLEVTGIGAATVLNSNPFFETNATGWTAAGGTFVRSTAQFHQGAASGLLTPNGVASAAEAFSDLVAVVPGVSYTASSWVRCAAARNVQVAIYWYTAGSVFITSTITTMAVPLTTWTQITATGEAPATATQARINHILTSTPPAGHLLHVDEAQLSAAGGQTFTVTQTPVNGAILTVPGGTPVSLANPMIVAL